MILTRLPEYEHWAVSDDIYASRVQGTFSPFHFLVRLRAEDRARLSANTDEIRTGGVDPALVTAFGTYVHETIHWWQHVGSTLGLMLSLTHPAQLHVNRQALRQLVERAGPWKSLMELNDRADVELPVGLRSKLNFVLNNWHDSQFNVRLLIDPVGFRPLTESPYFDSVGHSMEMGLAHSLWLLSASLPGPDAFLPDIRQWEASFEELRASKTNGFCPESPGSLVSIGALHIFEAQARFGQIQYIYLASGRELGWSDFRGAGMLGEVYVAAFRAFLKLTGLDWPGSPVDPVVQLFLLICDLSINPGEGYPFDLTKHAQLIERVHPGFRFAALCGVVRNVPAMGSAIEKVGHARYMELSEELCAAVETHSPTSIFTRIAGWTNNVRQVRELLREEAAWQFTNANFPARLWFSKHLRFIEDRIKYPEFFCWPAMHMAENDAADVDINASLMRWKTHEPLFIADMDGQVEPQLPHGVDRERVYQTANDFFSWQLIYDLTQQWIARAGPFDLNYGWLGPQYTADTVRPFLLPRFVDAVGVDLDRVRLCSP